MLVRSYAKMPRKLLPFKKKSQSQGWAFHHLAKLLVLFAISPMGCQNDEKRTIYILEFRPFPANKTSTCFCFEMYAGKYQNEDLQKH